MGNWKKSPILWMAGSVAGVGAIVGLLYAFGVHHQVLELLRWVDSQGMWAAAMFIGIMALAMVLLLPGVLLTTGAGFVFGVVQGTTYVVVGTTLGSAIAFLIARHFLGEHAHVYIRSRARLSVVSSEMAPHGWKIVLLTRLIPFFPGKLSNFLFGLTNFSFGGFIVGTFFGVIPFSLHNVYLGSLAADLSTLGARESARTPLEWTIYGAGFAGTVLAVVFLNRLARRALARYRIETETTEEDYTP
ncbi:TVP38/TMEM64 family protein [Marinobacter sp. M216]|uniref:TVP38/TMEM64 family membrane protein n=1 Tax=Marinobacter albus TaxID=3030833 RepID=A0ABT7H9J3_9GAMM|nr:MULTISPECIES: TVP38/TMEM64 family protein [unclassified Marinobacter]MBW7470723.1 TVP38/TMEM64 family protein [Marinobacter sp. F4218]MDK9557008.1 TVP38/TMEM64 family protein [Marinobacter sp. M216]